MEVFLLASMNFGSIVGLLALIIAVLLPVFLTLHCILDISRSKFTGRNSKWGFLVLVLMIPVFGSLIYLMMRRNYKVKPAFHILPNK